VNFLITIAFENLFSLVTASWWVYEDSKGMFGQRGKRPEVPF
jgi:hypothetical protein